MSRWGKGCTRKCVQRGSKINVLEGMVQSKRPCPGGGGGGGRVVQGSMSRGGPK